MRGILWIGSSALVMCISQVASGQQTWYVDGSVTEPGDGTSWQAAFMNIQEGINAASDGDTVTVARGTYHENIGFNGKNIVLRSTDPLNPTVVAGTIIDGNKAGSVVTFSGSEDETCLLSGFTIRNGEAAEGGGISGGEYEGSHTLVTIANNIISDNAAQFGGGGLAYCNGTIRRNVITGNSGGYTAGGGLSDCDGTIINNLIIANSASLSGGGLSACDGTIESNTIVGNLGGGIDPAGALVSCQGTIRNCIVWGNYGFTQMSDCSAPTYSCIQDWTEGGDGNISINPRFVDPDGADDDVGTFADNDYHLLPVSPCVDAGQNQDWMSDAVDLDGNPRIVARGGSFPVVDMGAYECVFRIERLSLLDGRAQLSWYSRPGETFTVWSCDDMLTRLWKQEETIASQGESTTWTDEHATSAAKLYTVEIK